MAPLKRARPGAVGAESDDEDVRGHDTVGILRLGPVVALSNISTAQAPTPAGAC
jgi:hypothetical protein